MEEREREREREKERERVNSEEIRLPIVVIINMNSNALFIKVVNGRFSLMVPILSKTKNKLLLLSPAKSAL